MAREIITVLQAHYKVMAGTLVGAMHDRAVDNLAMSTISVVYSDLLDVGCTSHTIDHVRDKFSTPVLDESVNAWVQMFSHSPKSRLLWSSRVGFSVRTLRKTRWWSRWEVIDQLTLLAR